MTKPSTVRRIPAQLMLCLLFAFATAATACSVSGNGNELDVIARTTTLAFADAAPTTTTMAAAAATTALSPATVPQPVAPSPAAVPTTDPLDHPCWNHVEFREAVCEIDGELSCYDFEEGIWSECEYYDHSVEPCDTSTRGGWVYVFSDKWLSFHSENQKHHHWIPTTAGQWEITYCFTNYRPGFDREVLQQSLLVSGTSPVEPCGNNYGVEVLRDTATRHNLGTSKTLDIPDECVGKEFALQRLEHAEVVMRIRPTQR